MCLRQLKYRFSSIFCRLRKKRHGPWQAILRPLGRNHLGQNTHSKKSVKYQPGRETCFCFSSYFVFHIFPRLIFCLLFFLPLFVLCILSNLFLSFSYVFLSFPFVWYVSIFPLLTIIYIQNTCSVRFYISYIHLTLHVLLYQVAWRITVAILSCDRHVPTAGQH